MRFLENWRELKKSRKISNIIKISLIIAGIALTSFSITSYISINTFLYNIEIPSDNAEINMNYTTPKEMYIKIPYEIKNKGYYDIIHIYLNVTIDIVYTSTKDNKETRETIFTKEKLIGYCRPGEKLTGNFKGDEGDFDLDELGVFQLEVDSSKEIKRLMDLILTADLAGAYHFFIHLEDIDLDED